MAVLGAEKLSDGISRSARYLLGCCEAARYLLLCICSVVMKLCPGADVMQGTSLGQVETGDVVTSPALYTSHYTHVARTRPMVV